MKLLREILSRWMEYLITLLSLGAVLAFGSLAVVMVGLTLINTFPPWVSVSLAAVTFVTLIVATAVTIFRR